MKTPLVLFIFFLASFHSLQAQFIGQSNIVLIDSSRSNRNIPVEIYYPATSAGTNTPPGSGTFPLLTIGHGFVMGIDAYEHMVDTLAPNGYAVVLVNTETSFSPNHATFGADLLFVNNYLKQQSQNNSSFILYQKLSNLSAIGGHSMGGGATMLAAAAAAPGEVTTIIGFAAAETTPSAINACTVIQIPALIFSGTADGVTPPVEHQIPMYDSLQSSCKYHIQVIGGGHCLFAKPNVACDFGESVSSTGITVTRADQHRIMFRYLKLWLDYHLQGNTPALTQLNNYLMGDSEVSFVRSCGSLSGVEHEGKSEINFRWKIQDHKLYVDLSEVQLKTNAIIEITSVSGTQLSKTVVKPTDSKLLTIDLTGYAKNLYILSLRVGKQINSSKFALP